MPDLWRRLGRLLLNWTLATAVAGSAGYIVIAAIANGAGPDRLAFGAAVAAGALAAGLLAGGLQQYLLKPFWSKSGGWLAASAAGWFVGLPLAVAITALLRESMRGLPDSYRLTVFLIGAGIAGAAASTFQWRRLRTLTDKHLWWLLANGVGWFMAWIVVLAVGLFLGEGEPLPMSLIRVQDVVLLGGLAGFVVGFEQAVALVGLLAQEAWENRKLK